MTVPIPSPAARRRTDVADAALLSAWRGGDAHAGDQLLRRHLGAVRRFLRLRAPAAVDDLVQATLLVAVRSTHGYRGVGSYRRFLLGVARYQVFHHLRARKRDRLVLDDARHDPAAPSTHVASEVLLRSERHQQLLRALDEIPTELRAPITMHYWGGLSTGELARVLDIPRGTAKSRLRRAREALHSRLRADGRPVSRTLRPTREW